MCAFVALGLILHIKPRDCLAEHLQNDLLCVEWVVKTQLNYSNLASLTYLFL